ncbi:MAG: VIT domain-containing protein [Polyangiaceae bacterium]
MPLFRRWKLTQTRVDGSVDSTAAVAYLEWTWVLSNASSVSAEARAELALPEGAVLSRATLWVNDEPREAVFAGRQEVVRAYENIVNRRRDPLLLTWIGPGRIELRCFPVLNQKPMKLRLGMTAPLRRVEEQKASLGLPRLENANFIVEAPQEIWLEATRTFRWGTIEAKRERDFHRLQRSVQRGRSPLLDGPLVFDVPGAGQVSWTPNPVETDLVVTQRIAVAPLPSPARVLVLLETSRGQSDAIERLADALEKTPKDVEIEVLASDGDGKSLGIANGAKRESLRALAQRVRTLKAVGGTDSVPSLLRALESAQGHSDTVLLWDPRSSTHQSLGLRAIVSAHRTRAPLGTHLRLVDGEGPQRRT